MAKVKRHGGEVPHSSPSAFPPCSSTSVDLALQSRSFSAPSHTGALLTGLFLDGRRPPAAQLLPRTWSGMGWRRRGANRRRSLRDAILPSGRKHS